MGHCAPLHSASATILLRPQPVPVSWLGYRSKAPSSPSSRVFKEGLAHHGTAPGVDAELLATTAAWAVFGAARRWFQTPNRIPAEEMAARIETMVSPVLFGASVQP